MEVVCISPEHQNLRCTHPRCTSTFLLTPISSTPPQSPHMPASPLSPATEGWCWWFPPPPPQAAHSGWSIPPSLGHCTVLPAARSMPTQCGHPPQGSAKGLSEREGGCGQQWDANTQPAPVLTSLKISMYMLVTSDGSLLTHTYTRTHMHTHMQTHTCKHTHAHTHTHTHTHSES